MCCRVPRVAVLAVSAIGSDTGDRRRARRGGTARRLATDAVGSPPSRPASDDVCRGLAAGGDRDRQAAGHCPQPPGPSSDRVTTIFNSPCTTSAPEISIRRSPRYKAVLQRDELNVEAHNNLGLLYKDKGLTDEALRGVPARDRRSRRGMRGRTTISASRSSSSGASTRPRPNSAPCWLFEPRNVDAIVNLALAQRSAGQTVGRRGQPAPRARDRAAQRRRALQPRPAVRGHRRSAVAPSSTTRPFLQYAGPEYTGRAPDVRARIVALQARIR